MGLLAGQSEPASFSEFFADGLRSGGVLRVLRTIRKYLGMDVAFVSRFLEQDRLMEHVDAEGPSPILAGQTIPLEKGYCLKVVLGQLPEMIPDTASVPAAVALPETRMIPIGSHMSVPIRLGNGGIYGTLCCFSYLPDYSLGERDLQVLRAFAEVLGAYFEEVSHAEQARAEKVETVRLAMSTSSPRIVYQPIYHLRTGTIAGMECLSRFDTFHASSPHRMFDLAEEVGLRQDLELAAIARAVRTLDRFPPRIYFGLNCSPQTIVSGAVDEALDGTDLHRLVIEITEHAIVPDYDSLIRALGPLRTKGLRVAIDDAGAGYASMRHIVSLQPDFIKLDMSLTRSVDKDPTRRALARALTSFSREIGSVIIAEGIETKEELDLLRALGVDTGQGFLLGRPAPLDVASNPATFSSRLHPDQIQLELG